MTKKDYILIADGLISRYKIYAQKYGINELTKRRSVLLDTASTLGNLFESDNPRFDIVKWDSYILKGFNSIERNNDA